jgi:hypothetical protein
VIVTETSGARAVVRTVIVTEASGARAVVRTVIELRVPEIGECIDCPINCVTSDLRREVDNCVIMQRVVVLHWRRFGKPYRAHPQNSRILDFEDGTDRLSRNVANELPPSAA